MANVASILNNLIETSKDGEKGFRKCAEDAKDADLKAFFLRGADSCARGAQELQSQVSRLGEKPTSSGSVAGAFCQRPARAQEGATVPARLHARCAHGVRVHIGPCQGLGHGGGGADDIAARAVQPLDLLGAQDAEGEARHGGPRLDHGVENAGHGSERLVSLSIGKSESLHALARQGHPHALQIQRAHGLAGDDEHVPGVDRAAQDRRVAQQFSPNQYRILATAQPNVDPRRHAPVPGDSRPTISSTTAFTLRPSVSTQTAARSS